MTETAQTDTAPTSERPLDGIVVADFSRVLAGPTATMVLADLGATVVKVEHPDGGDDTRHWGPPWTEDGSSYFGTANRTKRSIVLDLGNPGDLEVAHDLVDRADVLVENFRPGSLDKYGLDPVSSRTRNPGLVHCSISGFGAGAGAHLPGYDFLVQAVGGLMSITGQPGGDPQKVGVALVDVLTGKDAVIGILAALRHREATGRGQHVEVNLLQSLLGSLANQAGAFLATGRAPVPMGNQHPSIAPYETLRCADGLLAIACGNDRQFQRLCAVLDVAHLSTDPRFATNGDRVGHRLELVRLLEGRLGTRAAAQWQGLLAAADVPAGEVGDIAQGFELATALGLEPVVDMAGGTPQVAHPIRYSEFSVVRPAAPPALGQHSQEIRAWLATPPIPQEHP